LRIEAGGKRRGRVKKGNCLSLFKKRGRTSVPGRNGPWICRKKRKAVFLDAGIPGPAEGTGKSS